MRYALRKQAKIASVANAKYGNKEILPELHVIQEGSLSGFISINPRWSGFKARDYLKLSLIHI